MFGRKVIHTALDPIPRTFRACPGHIAMNPRELAAVQAGDREVVEELVDILQAEDAAEARGILHHPLYRRPTRALAPSARMRQAAALVGWSGTGRTKA